MGYANKVANNTTGTMKRMMCPSFIKVGEKDPGFYISDLKFDGYQNVEYYFSHGLTGFAVNLLESDGSPKATYQWVDEYNDETEVWSGGRWYHVETEKYIGEDDEPDVFLKPGEGLWCYMPRFRANDSTTSWTFCSAGEVLVKSQDVEMNKTSASMKRPIGNMINKTCKLTQISITGYQDVEYYFSHDLTGFAANLLESDGSPLATYKWVDEYDDENEVWSGGRWYHVETEKYIGEDDEPDVDVEPGDALWCYAPKFRANDTSECWSMIFPGLNAK